MCNNYEQHVTWAAYCEMMQRLAWGVLTTGPGPDIEPYHNHQAVILRPADWPAWIYLTRSGKELLQPLPVGSLQVETVRQGKD